MNKKKKIAFLFPGQGAQYTGMGKDFYDNFPLARRTFEEADDILSINLSEYIFNGPEKDLTITKNSQPAIFITSLAILRVIDEQFPNILPYICAGLSLGEYTALEAGGWISFKDGLELVRKRAEYMNDACEKTDGAMAAIIGLESSEVERVIKGLTEEHKVWTANFNCPGQVVISGTKTGVRVGIQHLLEEGARKAIPLHVHGAFHSGIMKDAQDKLEKQIDKVTFKQGKSKLIMNISGDFVDSISDVKKNLIGQMTNSVRWEQSIRTMEENNVDLFLEIGCGKTLSTMNKRIKVKVPTISVESVSDLDQLSKVFH